MNPNNFVMAQCFISLVALAYLWFRLFEGLQRDDFRCETRRLRDRLFDFMRLNGYSYDTPAYRETRQLLNGIIRFSTVKMPLVFLFEALTSKRRVDPAAWQEKLASVDEKLAAELERVRNQAIISMLQFTLLRGLRGLLMRGLYYLLRVAPKLKGLIMALKGWIVKKTGQPLVNWTFQLGSPDLSPVQCDGMVGRHRHSKLARSY